MREAGRLGQGWIDRARTSERSKAIARESLRRFLSSSRERSSGNSTMSIEKADSERKRVISFLVFNPVKEGLTSTRLRIVFQVDITRTPRKPDHSRLFTLAQSRKRIRKLWNGGKARRTNLDSKHWAGDREDGLWID